MASVSYDDDGYLGFREISLLVARTCDHLFPIPRTRSSGESDRSDHTEAHREADDPQVTFGKWVAYLLFRTRLPTLTVMHALHLLLRISILGDENIPLSFFTPTSASSMGTSRLHYRLFLAAAILGTAYNMDDAYSIRSWAIASQFTFPVAEIDRLQLDMLRALGWRLQAEDERMEHVVQIYEDEWLAELASQESARWREERRRKAKLSQIFGVAPEVLDRPPSSEQSHGPTPSTPALIVPASPMPAHQRTPRTPRTPAPAAPKPDAAALPLATLHWRDWVVSRSSKRSRSQERPPRPPPSPAPAASHSGWRAQRESVRISQEMTSAATGLQAAAELPLPASDNEGDQSSPNRSCLPCRPRHRSRPSQDLTSAQEKRASLAPPTTENEDEAEATCLPCRPRHRSRPSQDLALAQEKHSSLAPPARVDGGEEVPTTANTFGSKRTPSRLQKRRPRSADPDSRRRNRSTSREKRTTTTRPPVQEAHFVDPAAAPLGGRPPPAPPAPSLLLSPPRDEVAPWEAQSSKLPHRRNVSADVVLTSSARSRVRSLP